VKLLAAALILPAIIVLGIATFETRVLVGPGSNKPTPGIVWDNHTFASRAEFARWLRSHGTSYRVWARRHPSLSGVEPSRATQQRAKVAKAQGARQKPSIWSLDRLGGVAAVLAVLALGIVFVRRRRPGSIRPRTQGLRGAVRRASTATERVARLTMRRAGLMAPRFGGLLASADVVARRSLRAWRNQSELTWYLATAALAAGVAVVVAVWLNRA
jgi:hypothetical protein